MSRPERPGLATRLAALIPDATFEARGESTPGSELRRVPLDRIDPNPDQPREVFDPIALSALVESIIEHGVLCPLVVQPRGGRYELIAGERRLRASALAGLDEVPVVVRRPVGEAESLELALVENLQRADLDPVEAARGYCRLIEEFGHTQERVALRVGLNRATVANAVRLLRLPGWVLDRVRSGALSAGHARALLPVEEPLLLRRLVERVVAESLSVRTTERLVRSALAAADQPSAPPDPRQRGLAALDRRLSHQFATRVSVKPRKRGGGRIVIDYADQAQLDRLVDALEGDKQ